MKKISIILLMLIFNLSVYAQLQIVDQDNDEPVAFAHLIVGKGILGASSDIDGRISLSEIERKVKDSSDTLITIQHLGYENFEIGLQTLRQLSSVRLKKREIMLPEITVTARQSYDFLVLKGFYRSYHLEENVLKYYTDGIVEYYIPKDKNRRRPSFRLLEHRSFRNQASIDREKQRAVMVITILAGIPGINGKTVMDKLKKDCTLAGNEILRKDSTVGYIKTDTAQHTCQVNIDMILPEKEKIYSLFGYTDRLTNDEITENYLTNDMSGIKTDLLESLKRYRKVYASYKKDPGETLMEGVDEFYVIEKQYVKKNQLKGVKRKSDTSLPESTSFSYDYWNTAGQYGIPPLSRQIENELGTSLLPY